MAKLKNNIKRVNPGKIAGPVIAQAGLPSIAKISIPKPGASRLGEVTNPNPPSRSLHFGSFHSKASTTQSSGSSWTGLLNAASSGGASAVLGGGLLSSGTLGIIGKLFSLFGDGNSNPPVPSRFQLPASQATSLDIASPAASNSVSVGIQQASTQTSQLQTQTSPLREQPLHSSEIIQVVKQALLTSSSLNDVISEI